MSEEQFNLKVFAIVDELANRMKKDSSYEAKKTATVALIELFKQSKVEE